MISALDLETVRSVAEGEVLKFQTAVEAEFGERLNLMDRRLDILSKNNKIIDSVCRALKEKVVNLWVKQGEWDETEFNSSVQAFYDARVAQEREVMQKKIASMKQDKALVDANGAVIASA